MEANQTTAKVSLQVLKNVLAGITRYLRSGCYVIFSANGWTESRY